MERYIELYCQGTGRKGIDNIDWYFAYNMFRLAGIIQGIVGRVRDGTAASAHAQDNADRVKPLALAAYGFALKAGMTP
jgi:aminoglycoside phosphotransferase (APT) family kinase protein